MKVTKESATVWRGGGRRYFTKSAAINAEARASYNQIVKSSGRCECGSQFVDGYGEMNDYCLYHDHTKPLYRRYIRLATLRILKARGES